MFGFIKDTFKKVYDSFTTQANSLFARGSLDESFLKELTALLIAADTGVATTNAIIQSLSRDIKTKKISTPEEARQALEALLVSHLEAYPAPQLNPRVLLMVGVNGSGKTTFISKFAHKLACDGKKVLVVAGDTFRAAATEQLASWCNKIGTDIFIGRENQDPASVIFDACKKFTAERYDHLIIDTAGRLQSKTNLMKELAKIRSIIARHFAENEVCTWLTIDAMLGQNSLTQAKVFNETTSLSGLVVTKLDGTGKGGTIFAIVQELKRPIVYATFGEELESMSLFDAKSYVSSLLKKKG